MEKKKIQQAYIYICIYAHTHTHTYIYDSIYIQLYKARNWKLALPSRKFSFLDMLCIQLKDLSMKIQLQVLLRESAAAPKEMPRSTVTCQRGLSPGPPALKHVCLLFPGKRLIPHCVCTCPSLCAGLSLTLCVDPPPVTKHHGGARHTWDVIFLCQSSHCMSSEALVGIQFGKGEAVFSSLSCKSHFIFITFM